MMGIRKGDFMNWKIHLCFMNMKRRKVRTVLTVLGAAIGVVSLVSLLAIGIGVKKELIGSMLASESVNKITITGENYGRNKEKMLTDSTIERISEFSNVADCYGCYEAFVNMEYGRYVYWGYVTGIPEEKLDALKLKSGDITGSASGVKPDLIFGGNMASMFFDQNTGETFADIEGKKADAFIGERLKTVFVDSEENVSARLKVAAVTDGGDYDESSQQIYCNIDTLIRMLKRNSSDGKIAGQPVDADGNAYKDFIYSSAVVTVDSIDNVDAVVKRLQDMGFQTQNSKEYLDMIKKNVKMIQILLGVVGMIALVVAVIGISNTMTTSVFDRVNEIGILKVLGCDPDELRQVFLFEAGLLGLLGGVAGVLVSVFVKTLINKVAVWAFSVSAGVDIAVMPWWLGLGAIAGSAVLGILAGYFPARWASRLKPIDAVGRI